MDSGDRPHPLHALHFAAVMLVAVLSVLLFTNEQRRPATAALQQPGGPAQQPAPVSYVTRFPDVDAAYPVTDPAGGDGVIAVSLGAAGTVDRCMTCHRFAGLADLPDPRAARTWQPYGSAAPVPVAAHESWLVTGSHPGGWLNWHPPKFFGCVSCHGGDGAALDYRGAGHRAWTGRRPWQPVMNDDVRLLAACGRCHTGGYVAGAEQVWRGRQLIREYNCAACHEVSAQLTGDRQGPSLARVGEKLGAEVLALIPNHTADLLGSTRMPQFRLSRKDRELIAVYLSTLGKMEPYRDAAKARMAEADTAHGLELIRQGRCVNCHTLPPPGAEEASDMLWQYPQGEVGPSLANIADRHVPRWTVEFLADPRAWYPETRMPDYPELTEDDRWDIAAWLHLRSLDHTQHNRYEGEGFPFSQLDSDLLIREGSDQGRTLFVSNGCASCHDTGDEQVAARKIGLSLVNVGDKDWALVPEQAQHFGDLHTYFTAKLEDPTIVNNALMPQFDLTDDEIAAIAVALLAEGASPPPGYAADLWSAPAAPPGSAAEIEQNFWDWPLAWQGAGDSHLSMTERDLAPEACATCHREQYAQWQTSRHAMSMGPGMTGQMIDAIADDPSFYFSCMRCHARLAEQLHVRQLPDPAAAPAWEANPHFRGQLYEAAHGCANCHVRGLERFTLSEPRQDYIWDTETLDAHQLTRSKYFEQSNYCRDCHQFETDSAVAPGLPPRENTYREWEEWNARAEEPQTCQQCHMPDGDHSFKGIHDRDYVAENVTVTSGAELQGGAVSAWITLENTKGGHHLPTYITPKIYFRAVQLDAAGAELAGTFDEYMLGRHAATRPRGSGRGREWFDHYDTRIPAGDAYTYIYEKPLESTAEAVRLQLLVAPDDFYNKAYAKWITNENRSPEGRELLAQAYAETLPEVSGYYLLDQLVELAP